jgi:hypothetical protein
VPSFGLEDNTSADDLIAFVKNVQAKGGMGVIMFHGIGGDYITTSSAAHQALLDYLAANKKVYLGDDVSAGDGLCDEAPRLRRDRGVRISGGCGWSRG